MRDVDAIIIGGGFYGAEIALSLAARGFRCTLLEREQALLSRASFANQARVHGGYHYPRSINTGLRSRANYKPFLAKYGDAVVRGFTKLYAVSRRLSHVTARQFEGFCRRIGAPLREAARPLLALFNLRLVERVYEVEECAFDARVLREILQRRLSEQGVDVQLGAEVSGIAKEGDDLRVEWADGTTAASKRGRHVFLCTYAATNRLLRRAGLSPLPLRSEMTELALVEAPPPFDRLGITVMCGPFFSVMPHPGTAAHTLSHVRYTPHASWAEEELGNGVDPMTVPRRSRFEQMRRDAARFVPGLEELRQTGSLWEAKALLPRNDADDGRPILFKRDHDLVGLHCVLGGKIDNIFDVLKQLEALRS